METLVRPKSSDNLERQDVDVEDQGKLDAEFEGIAEERIELEKEESLLRSWLILSCPARRM